LTDSAPRTSLICVGTNRDLVTKPGVGSHRTSCAVAGALRPADDSCSGRQPIASAPPKKPSRSPMSNPPQPPKMLRTEKTRIRVPQCSCLFGFFDSMKALHKTSIPNPSPSPLIIRGRQSTSLPSRACQQRKKNMSQQREEASSQDQDSRGSGEGIRGWRELCHSLI
jgi:hypothetical protein